MADMASDDVLYRRRGRPSGKNRVPLSLNERRARNAQYERERRHETSEAMSELAEAAGLEPGLSNADILATVISQLQKGFERDPSNDIRELNRINEKLMLQIESIEQRLSNWKDNQGSEQTDDIAGNDRKRRGKELTQPSKGKRTSQTSLDITLTPSSNNDI